MSGGVPFLGDAGWVPRVLAAVQISMEFLTRPQAAEMIRQLVLGDRVEPGGEGKLRIEVRDLETDFEKHFLADIIGRGPISTAGENVAVQWVEMSSRQFVICSRLAGLPAECEIVVAG